MSKYIGDLMMGGFVIVLLVLFLRKPGEAIQLLKGTTSAYTDTVTGLATVPIN